MVLRHSAGTPWQGCPRPSSVFVLVRAKRGHQGQQGHRGHPRVGSMSHRRRGESPRCSMSRRRRPASFSGKWHSFRSGPSPGALSPLQQHK
jgi:hypothetical protein